MSTGRKIFWIGVSFPFIITGVIIYAIITGDVASGDPWELEAICLVLFIQVALFGKQAFKGTAEQRLTLLIPIPADAVPEIVPLLLDPDDVRIYDWMKTRGKTTQTAGGVKIQYKGPKVYYPTSNKFKVDGRKYAPKAIQVLQ
jgi:hypothetical protein